MLDDETKLYSLYGKPIGHSLSPTIFNYAFEKLGMNSAYVPFEVSAELLEKAVQAAVTLGFEGFNVTMPHKVAILKHLDRLDNTAKRVQAVNTVAMTPRGLVGYNTDGEGAYGAIRTQGLDPRGKTVTVIGAGGAASAIAQRLSQEAEEVQILNRRREKAKLIAERVTGPAKARYGGLTTKTLKESIQKSELLVNATPLHTTELLESVGLTRKILPSKLWVFDLAYNKSSGLMPSARTISPLEMLLQQAALSYKIWLGKGAPLELMRTALAQHNRRGWK